MPQYKNRQLYKLFSTQTNADLKKTLGADEVLTVYCNHFRVWFTIRLKWFVELTTTLYPYRDNHCMINLLTVGLSATRGVLGLPSLEERKLGCTSLQASTGP